MVHYVEEFNGRYRFVDSIQQKIIHAEMQLTNSSFVSLKSMIIPSFV